MIPKFRLFWSLSEKSIFGHFGRNMLRCGENRVATYCCGNSISDNLSG
jgi:hypothetical protein